MKKVVLFIALFASLAVAAQIEFKPGVKSGINISNVSNINNSNSVTDFYIGILGTVKFVHFYNLQPEIIYSRQGFEQVAFNNVKSNYQLDYLSIVIANKFFPFRDIGLHAIIGPSFDILLNDKVEISGFSISDAGVEGFDFAMIGGLGYEFPFGLSLEARFKHGFVDIYGSNINNNTAFDELLANQVFQIGATYQFDL